MKYSSFSHISILKGKRFALLNFLSASHFKMKHFSKRLKDGEGVKGRERVKNLISFSSFFSSRSRQLPQRQHQQQHRPDMLIRDEQQQQLSRLVIALVVIFLICHTPNAVYSLCQAASNFLSATFASSDDDDSTARSNGGDDGSDRKIGKKFGSGEENSENA